MTRSGIELLPVDRDRAQPFRPARAERLLLAVTLRERARDLTGEVLVDLVDEVATQLGGHDGTGHGQADGGEQDERDDQRHPQRRTLQPGPGRKSHPRGTRRT